MRFLPLILLIFSGTQPFVLHNLDIYKQNIWEADNGRERQHQGKGPVKERDELWLLDLLPEDQKLRRADEKERTFFESSFGDLIDISEKRRSPGYAPGRRIASIARNSTDALEDQAVQDQIRTTVNKFVLSSLQERAQELDDFVAEGTDPTITLYIRSPYSAIVISYGDREWHFFLRPPSPLPDWLYKFHRTTAIDVANSSASSAMHAEDKKASDVKKLPSGETEAVRNTAGNVLQRSKVDMSALEVGGSTGVTLPANVRSALHRALFRYLKVALRCDLA